jgi:hypothetical protein
MKKRGQSEEGKKPKKPQAELPASLLKNLIVYLFSEFRRRNACKKILYYFSSVDMTPVLQDPDLEIYYRMADVILRTIVDDSITDDDVIADRVQSHPKYADDFTAVAEDLYETEFGEAMAIYVENEFVDRLNYVQASPIVAEIKALATRFEKGDFDNYQSIIGDIQGKTSEFNRQIALRTSSVLSIPDLDFCSPEIEDNLQTIHKQITDKTLAIKTGVKRLNEALHGGWQPGRLYVFLATSGGWKSGFLLNSWMWGGKYNCDITCRDPKRKPLFLYISQENSTQESTDRMYSYVRGVDPTNDNEINITSKEFYRRLQKEGVFHPDTHNVRFKYFKKYQLNALGIESLVHEIEAEGEYEVKLIIHDYLKRLSPNVVSGDLRIDLGECANDLTELAKALQIPVITANQVNREAYKIMMQAGTNEAKNDLGRNASLTMQSESQMITENADVVYMINKEYSKANDTWYLTFTDLKNRGQRSNKTAASRYFAHPFEQGNSMRLVEDFEEAESFSLDSIADSLEGYDPNDEKGDSTRPSRPGKKGQPMKARRVDVADEIES